MNLRSIALFFNACDGENLYLLSQARSIYICMYVSFRMLLSQVSIMLYVQAELMYRVAVDKARGLSKMEPVAICNYGIFLYNQRQDAERAIELLRDGLQRLGQGRDD